MTTGRRCAPDQGRGYNDALFEPKKSWVLAAYQAAESGTLDGVVVSFDE
jgi:hypothetical protein